MSTSAVEVSIQAVSPALSLSAATSAGAVSAGAADGAAGASAVALGAAAEAPLAGSSPWASGAQRADINTNTPIDRLIISSLP